MYSWESLKSSKDFDRVISIGKKVKNDSFVVYSLPSKEGKIRIGICVGKSLGKAVKRNRLRRQIREALRKIHTTNDSPKDIVIIARKGIMGASFKKIFQDLELLMEKI